MTGFDLTFSAPKSVSALWALTDPSRAAEVVAAHRSAVRAALGYLDTHAALSRRGTDGVQPVGTAGLAAALFDHRTSRAGDPQLHTHALVLNKVRCPDGAWRTLDATELFHHKKSTGMVYQAALRNELHQRLGVTFGEVNEHGQSDLAGVPDQLLSLWSKRTASIDAEAGPKIFEYEKLLGRTLNSAERVAVVKTAVLKTRTSKQHPQVSALHATWTAEVASAGWTPDRLTRAVRLSDRPGRPVVPEPTQVPETAVAVAALQAAGMRRAVFSRADVAGQVAARLPTSGLTASQVVARVEQLTDLALGLEEAVPVGLQTAGVTVRASDARYATVMVLSAEARILDLAGRGRRGGYGQLPPGQLTGQLADQVRSGRLDASQYRAVRQLTAGGDFLTVLTAPAGAGKTSTLGAATAAWRSAGFRVVGLAPSARAAAELATATGQGADTLAKWLHTQQLLRRPAAGAAPAGPESDRDRWAELDDRTVLIVDEASMASTLDLDELTAAAARAAAKVVLVGDPAQIGVVAGPGGMLAALAHAGHGVELDEVHRFSQPWERAASLGLRQGRPHALTAYQTAGRLHPCPNGDSALDGVFGHWAAARARGWDALMLARSRLDVDALNRRARAAALAAGQISGPVTTAGGRTWQAGTCCGPGATTAGFRSGPGTSATATATRSWAPDLTTG